MLGWVGREGPPRDGSVRRGHERGRTMARRACLPYSKDPSHLCGGMRRAAQALLKLAWRPPDNVRLRARDGGDASTARSMRRVQDRLQVDIDQDPGARGRAAARWWVSSMRWRPPSQGHPPPALPPNQSKASSRSGKFCGVHRASPPPKRGQGPTERVGRVLPILDVSIK